MFHRPAFGPVSFLRFKPAHARYSLLISIFQIMNSTVKNTFLINILRELKKDEIYGRGNLYACG